MKELILTFLSLSISLSLYAREQDGHSEGNGGAGICINGICKSLAKAGLRINTDYQGPYYLSHSIVKEVNRIIDLMPMEKEAKNYLRMVVFQSPGTFVPVKTVDRKKYKKTIATYLEIFQSQSQTENLELLAISDQENKNYQDPRTFLLPSFFNADLETQALTIIHEGLVRGKPSNAVKDAIQLDFSLYNLLNKKDEFDIGHFIYTLRKLQFYKMRMTSEVLGTTIIYFQDYLNQPLRLDLLINNSNDNWYFNYYSLLELSNYSEYLPSLLSNRAISKLSPHALIQVVNIAGTTREFYRANPEVHNKLNMRCSQSFKNDKENYFVLLKFDVNHDGYVSDIVLECGKDQRAMNFYDQLYN